MKQNSILHGLRGYLAFVVAPVILATAAGAVWWTVESDRLVTEHYEELSRQAVQLLVRDLAQGREAFAERARSVELPDPAPPAVERALAGDTVSGLASSDQSLELTVVVADEDGTVRMIREPFVPPSLEALPAVAGQSMAIYLAGLRVATTDPAIGPAELDRTILTSLIGEESTLEWETGGERGIFRPVQPRPGAEPDLVLLVGTAEASMRLEWLLIVVPVTLIILALVITAAWSIAGSESREDDGDSRVVQTALIVCIPVLAGLAVLVSLDRGFRNEVMDSGRGRLTEAAALIQELRLGTDPRNLADIFGFEVAVMEAGRVVEATNGAEPLRDQLADVTLPPPNWLASGTVPGSMPPVPYEAFRLRGPRGVVLFRTDLDEKVTRLRGVLLRIGVVMALPAMIFLAATLLAAPPARDRPDRRRPSHFVDISSRGRTDPEGGDNAP